MKKSIKFLPLLATGLLAVGCQDYDAGFTEADIVAKKYATNFEKAFGDIDPNQNWSMAQQVTANVAGVEDGTLEIYYSDPIGGQPIMLTQQKIVGGEATVKFDVVKGTKQIFARINDGTGYYSMKSHFQIVDGVVNITPAMTRIGAAPTGTSRVTKSEAQTFTSPQLINWDKTDIVLIPQDENSYYIDGSYGFYTGDTPSTIYMSQGASTQYYKSGDFTNVYMLYNVINDNDERPSWYVKDIAPFFTPIDGHEAVFAEGVNHVKFMKENSYPQLEKDLVFEMEANGPFYLDYFAKGTAFDNKFGYFYFKGDNPTPEQFMTMPKFILVDNMSGHEYGEGLGNKVTTVDADTKKNWDLLYRDLPQEGWETTYSGEWTYSDEGQWDTKVVGTRIQLTYFGENGTDAEGSYTFPAGTKIGLFIIGNGDNRENEFITSIASINLKLFNEYPHAAQFQYNDQVVFAMEDQHHAGDADVNDVMFIANGKFKKTNIPVIDPVKPTFPTWVVACEDLGGTFDYDFNDVVFGLRKEDKAEGPSDLYLVPLAAGGTLKAELYFDNATEPIGEIHDLVKSGADYSTPLNVTAGSTPTPGNAIKLGTVAKDKSINDCAKMINIKVTKEEATDENNKTYNVGYHYQDDDYEAPEAIILPAGWDWPSEMTFIGDIYSGISSWVANGDVTTWCSTKEPGATKFVHNPLPNVPTPSEPSEGESTPTTPETPTVDPTKPEWDITVNGNATMEKGTTQTLTVTIDGVSDYSGLTFGTYSTSVITATHADGAPANEFVITGKDYGTALFWVKMAGDDTHNLTRKDYEINVSYPTPEFTLSVNGTVVGDTYNASVTDQLTVTCTVTKGLDYFMYDYVSSDTEVAEISSQGVITIHKAGTTTISKTHKGGNAGPSSWKETTVSFELIISEASSGSDQEDDDSKDPVDVTPVTILNSDVTVNGNNGSAKLTLNWPENSNGYSKLVVSLTPTGAAKIQFKSEWTNAATNEIDVPADASSIEIPLLSNGISILQTQGGAYVWNNSGNSYTITKIELQ